MSDIHSISSSTCAATASPTDPNLWLWHGAPPPDVDPIAQTSPQHPRRPLRSANRIAALFILAAVCDLASPRLAAQAGPPSPKTALTINTAFASIYGNDVPSP